MKTQILVVALSLAGVATGASQTAAKISNPPTPTISTVRAHLFQSKTAKLSDDITDPKFAGLSNTFVGPTAASATVVVIEVSGPPGAAWTGVAGALAKYTVRLVATEPGPKPKVLLDWSQAIPALSDTGKAYLPFLVYQSGCVSVRLAATVAGPHPGKPVNTVLPFTCSK